MKRLWGRIALAILLVGMLGLVFYLRSNPPFLAIASDSMEPSLSRGDLIFVNKMSAYELKEGDVVVFEVPRAIQEKYNYPSIIAHRIIRVTLSGTEIAFRTKGDATGADPFTVLPGQVRGQVGQSVSYLGYIVLFLQTTYGLVFVVTSLFIYLVYANSERLGRTGRRVRGAIFGMPAEEFERGNAELQERVQVFSLGVQQSLQQFAGAMGEYAKHIGSHTDAVKSMASASQELRNAVREQNKMFGSWQGAAGEKQAESEAIQASIPGCYREKQPFVYQHKPVVPGCHKELKRASLRQQPQ